MGAGSTSGAVVGGGIGIVGQAQNGNLQGMFVTEGSIPTLSLWFVRADSQNLRGGARDGGCRKARAREGNEGKRGRGERGIQSAGCEREP